MNHAMKKKSISLAVILAIQTISTHAEEHVKSIEKNVSAINKQEDKPERELSEINVKSTYIQTNDGYQATKTRVGKTLQDPHDIPQAVTTITNSLIQDQQLSSLREALSNVAGITFNAAEGGRAGDNMMLRGFYTFGDIYLDGIRDTAQYNRELFNLEQVDVLRGSAAMLFGRGQAGGVINQVTKMAELKDANSLSTSIGSYDYYSLTGDLNKKLNDTTAVRINFMDRAEENYRKNPSNSEGPKTDRQGLAVSFGTGIGTNNEFFLNHVTTITNDDPDYGVAFDSGTKKPINVNVSGVGPIDDSVYFGGKETFDESNTSITTAIFTHKFSQDTQLRTQVRNADYQRSYWAQTPGTSAYQTENYSQGRAKTRTMHYQTDTVQTDFNTKFDALGFKNKLLAGAEYLKEKNYRNSLLDLDSSSAGVFYTANVESADAPATFIADNYAVYLQNTVTVAPKWDVIFGVRRDELRANYSSLSSPQLSYGENSYRGALSYHQTPEQHYYASWSDSFSPTADLYQLSGGELPAERSKTKELGAKWLFLDGDLALRTALYRTDKEWERNTDLESTAALLSRKRHTNGLEFELAGRVSSQWEVFGGLALMNAKIDEQYDGTVRASFAEITNNGTASGPTGLAGAGYATGESADASQLVYANRSQQASEGNRPRNTPKLTLNLWSTYKITDKWKTGLGLEAKAERYGYGVGTCGTVSQNTTVGNANYGKWSYANCSTAAFNPNTVPGYVRLDAMLTYEEKKWAAKLNVKNLLNKVYYDAIYDNGGFSVPGNSRTVILTTEFKF
ncbi:MAG: TonB-dependent receptor [Sulfuritalea sp.]|nr:TonB-dependent receptor [Sulfuritalea sp.]